MKKKIERNREKRLWEKDGGEEEKNRETKKIRKKILPTD